MSNQPLATQLYEDAATVRSALDYSDKEWVSARFIESASKIETLEAEVASLRSDRERRREWLEQPITKAEKQLAYEHAKELAREQVNGTIHVQQLCIGVDAAWEYCEALVEATKEVWEGEHHALKSDVGRLERIEAAATKVHPLIQKAFVELRSRGVAMGLVADLQPLLYDFAAALQEEEAP